jgi:hypothetical protein
MDISSLLDRKATPPPEETQSHSNQSTITPIQNDHHSPPAVKKRRAPRKDRAKKPHPKWDSKENDLIGIAYGRKGMGTYREATAWP